MLSFAGIAPADAPGVPSIAARATFNAGTASIVLLVFTIPTHPYFTSNRRFLPATSK